MKKILTASSNENVIATVKNVCNIYSSFFNTDIISETDEIIRYIDYELPDIKVLDFTSKDIDCKKILDEINKDTWLHYGGVIAVCENRKQVNEVEEFKDSSILTIQTVDDFVSHFIRILRILWQNQKFLFNRGMWEELSGEECGTFVFGNDAMDMQFYTKFLVNYLYSTNRISNDDRFNLELTFNELLTNALEHGNLEISNEEKTAWLMEGNDMIDLIRQRSKEPGYKDRKIRISYMIQKNTSKFAIKDDGKGFDWRKAQEKKADENELHGRGIAVSRTLVKDLIYNDKGNEVAFIINNLQNQSSAVPGVMHTFETLQYQDRQVVVKEGDQSNDLFFIVSGSFAVYAGNKLTTVLSPNDLFIGEMAFLLNDRRTATVICIGECRLIKIPKKDFLLLIRKNPHYGIFLSKMLAQRLVRQTRQSVDLKKALETAEA